MRDLKVTCDCRPEDDSFTLSYDPDYILSPISLSIAVTSGDFVNLDSTKARLTASWLVAVADILDENESST